MKNFLKRVSIILPTLVIASPLVASAQAAVGSISGQVLACSVNVQDFRDILCKIGYFLNALIPILLALGVVYFVWGVVQYVIGGSDEDKTKGRDRIIYGIIGFVVILGLWGLVRIVITSFGIQQDLSVVNPTSLFVQNANNSSGASSSCDSTLGNNPKLQNIISYATCIIGASVIPLIFALATITFFWGAVQFLIIGAGDEQKRTQGKQLMIWGIIALVVMVSVWGLVKIVGSTFGFDTTYLPQVHP